MNTRVVREDDHHRWGGNLHTVATPLSITADDGREKIKEAEPIFENDTV